MVPVNPDAGGRPDEPDLSGPCEQVTRGFASHAGRAHHDRADLFARKMEDFPALPYASHHTHGVLDFEVARGPGDAPGTFRIVEDFEAGAPPCRRAAQRIGYAVTNLDRRLREARTGDLIRVVVHCSRLAVFCDQVVPGEQVVAVAQLPPVPDDAPLSRIPDVRRADRAVSALVDGIRGLISQEPQNLGGWLTSRPDDPDQERSREGRPGAPRVVRDGSDPRAIDLLEGVLDLDGPHFLALFTDQRLRARVDLLDDERLQAFALYLSAQARRTVWTDLGTRFCDVRRDLTEILTGLEAGTLRRLVLDVERGAVYLYPLDDDTYLIGATLKQRRVSQTDDTLAGFVSRVTEQLRAVPDGPEP